MKLGIIIGSIREGRLSDRLAKCIDGVAKAKDIDSKILDLKEFNLPFFNEARSPQANPDRQPSENIKAWLTAVGECDAIVLVSPEYNRSYSPVLKNALDHLAFEIKRKPVLLASHGSTGGAQAVSHLRGMLAGLQAITIPPAVMIVGSLAEIINENGEVSDELKSQPYGPPTMIGNALDELKWFSDSLAQARS